MADKELEAIVGPEMNGDTESIKKALLTFCRLGTSHITQIRNYQSELWARGVTKEEFLAWAKEQPCS